jgi:hypothetical protein
MIVLKSKKRKNNEFAADITLIRRYMNGHGYDASDEDIEYTYREYCQLNDITWSHIWLYRYLGSLDSNLPRAARNIIFLLLGGTFEERTRGIYTMVFDGKDTTPAEFDKIWKKDVDSDDDWRYNLDMTNDTEIKPKL